MKGSDFAISPTDSIKIEFSRAPPIVVSCTFLRRSFQDEFDDWHQRTWLHLGDI